MSDMTKSQLEKTVKRYLDNGEPTTAQNYIMNFGPQIEGYDVEEELFKLKEKTKPKKELKED